MNVKYFNILLILTIFVSCNPDKENIITDQIANIEKYLTSEKKEYVIIDGVYKSLRDTFITPGTTRPQSGEVVLADGDVITINYVAKLFTTSPTTTYDTNIFVMAKEAGLDTLARAFVPLEIKYGTTPLINGLRSGLKDSKKGDTYSLYIPYTAGYGEKGNGMIPGSSAINFEIDVLEIKK